MRAFFRVRIRWTMAKRLTTEHTRSMGATKMVQWIPSPVPGNCKSLQSLDESNRNRAIPKTLKVHHSHARLLIESSRKHVLFILTYRRSTAPPPPTTAHQQTVAIAYRKADVCGRLLVAGERLPRRSREPRGSFSRPVRIGFRNTCERSRDHHAGARHWGQLLCAIHLSTIMNAIAHVEDARLTTKVRV